MNFKVWWNTADRLQKATGLSFLLNVVSLQEHVACASFVTLQDWWFARWAVWVCSWEVSWNSIKLKILWEWNALLWINDQTAINWLWGNLEGFWLGHITSMHRNTAYIRS